MGGVPSFFQYRFATPHETNIEPAFFTGHIMDSPVRQVNFDVVVVYTVYQEREGDETRIHTNHTSLELLSLLENMP